MQITPNKVVTIDFTLTNTRGEVIETSKGRQPLAYIHGSGMMIPGLEVALEGKSVGDALSVTVQPEQAYGHRSDKLVQAVPRHLFQGVDNIQPGMRFQAQTPDGPRVVTVVGVTPESVTVDANHPLAGETLKFDVTVIEVREPTAEEISHGHAHGPGGHSHE
jgi:FKBP-type peptidyl-prolyl cis-trans isomerase SlyD